MRNDFESNYLEHSAKGTSWKNVKYLKKVPLGNGKYYYIYTQAELNAWNRKNSGGASNVLSNEERTKRIKAAASSNALNNIVKNGLVAKGQTAAEKTANLKKNISDGQKKIQQALEDSESKSKSKGGSGGSSKGSSGKSGGKGKKGGSSGKSSKEGASKEKAAKEKTAKTPKEKTTAEKTTKQKKTVDNTPINMDTLKKVYGKKDEDISSFSGTASEFKNNLLEKYKDGAFGYLTAGNKVYKFVVEGSNVILKDYNTDKEVSFDDYLKDAKEFKEFQTNKKKK